MIGLLSAKAAVTYPGADTSGMMGASFVEVREGVNKQTLVTITHPGSPEYFTRGLGEGSPMRLDTGSRYGQRSWFGYVADVVPAQGGERDTTEVTCVGVTYPAKRTSYAVWADAPLPGRMEQIIYSHGLVPNVCFSSIYQTIPQNGRTDFEVLVDMAETCGFDVFATGVTVNVMSPEDSLYTFRTRAAQLSRATGRARMDVLDSLDTVVYMDSGDRQQWEARAAVDPVTAAMVTAVGRGRALAPVDAPYARSLPTLRAKADRPVRIGEMPLSATTSGPGNVLVRAGLPVWLDDEGTGRWWMCESVTHQFDLRTDKHTTEAVLRRSTGLPDFGPPATGPRREINRSSPRFCFCREEDPLLVPASRSGYITSQTSTPGTAPVPTGVDDMLQGGGLGRRTGLGPPKPWVSSARWRARGRCDA